MFKKQRLSKTSTRKNYKSNNHINNTNNNKEKQELHNIRNHSKCNRILPSSKINKPKLNDKKSHAKRNLANKKTTQNKMRAMRSDSQQQLEYLERSKIFYSKSYSERISSKHQLFGVDSSNAGAYKVLNSIYSFAPPAPTISGKIQRLPKHLVGVKNLIKTVIENFKKLKMIPLLKLFCPCPRWLGGVRKGFGRTVNFWSKIHYRFLVKSFTPVEKVKYYSYLSTCSAGIVGFLCGSDFFSADEYF